MNPLVLSLLFAAAFGAFLYFTWRKLAIVAALQPTPRTDAPWARVAEVVRNGLLQQRMLHGDWRAGLMHYAIFAGFLVLLVRKVQLLVIGFDAHFTYPEPAGSGFAFAKDVVELVVLAAVGYGFWRRLVTRPQRLEPNREALAILALIAVIMITDLAYDGFRFALLADAHPAIAQERSVAFVGRAIGDLLAGWSPQALTVGLHAMYWAQILAVFGFMVWLPLGEHFHIVTALPALYAARRPTGPLAVVPRVDLAPLLEGTDDDLKVGVRSARDLTWKEGLDAFTCTECGRCKEACPTFLTGKPLSMKWTHDALKHHLLDQRERIVARADDALPALVPAVISEDSLWACTTCGWCEIACPIELEHLPRFYRLRQHQVMMEGVFPAGLKPVFEAYEATSNPWGMRPETRADWARDLDVPIARSAADIAAADWLFYVGSAASFDARAQKIARAFVQVMQAAGVRLVLLGAAEGSTGECVRRAGNELLFQTLAATLVQTLNGLGVRRIVTCDPHAFNSLKNEYPEFGGHYEVVHHTQLIAQTMAAGRLQLAPSFERVLLHDPCYLGRHNGEYDAPRAVLAQVTRDAPLEFPLSRDRAMCCGAGGGRMWMEEHIGKRINVTRVEQALPVHPAVIATACPYCALMMTDGIAALPEAAAIQTFDIAELVARALVPQPSAKP